jgi:hypothetical protein
MQPQKNFPLHYLPPDCLIMKPRDPRTPVMPIATFLQRNMSDYFIVRPRYT